MILIGGDINLKIEDLPMHEMMDYQIEQGGALKIKLKTFAKKEECFGVYLHKSLEGEYTLNNEVYDKTIFFKDEEELIKLLEDGDEVSSDIFEEEFDKNTEEDFDEDIIEEDTEEDFEEDFEEGNIEETKTEEFKNEIEEEFLEEDYEEKNEQEEIENQETEVIQEVEEVDEVELVDINSEELFFQVPELTDDLGELKGEIKSQEKIINQKNIMIDDLKGEIKEMYHLQEIQMKEFQNKYTEKIKKLKQEKIKLQEITKKTQLDEETFKFSSFAKYAKSPRAFLSVDFTDVEYQQMGKIKSKFKIFTSGSGGSVSSSMREIKKLIESNSKSIVVDCSSKYVFKALFPRNEKIQYNNLDLLSTHDPSKMYDMFKDVGKTKLCLTAIYNDIALLNYDWVKIIKALDKLASGRQVIFVFNSIESFPIKYIVSKLANIGELFVFCKDNPMAITSTYFNLKFIPSDRVNLALIDYVNSNNKSHQIINKLKSKYNFFAFENTVDWKKIGVKI